MAKDLITAAGGLVLNAENSLLMIFRRGHWDLPKGKWDEGETIEECAVREVQEETGVQQLTIERFIGITTHNYFNEYTQLDTDKKTHWYLMRTNEATLVPQQEEDIEIAEWVPISQIHEKLNNTYPTIIEIIEASALTKNL